MQAHALEGPAFLPTPQSTPAAPFALMTAMARRARFVTYQVHPAAPA